MMSILLQEHEEQGILAALSWLEMLVSRRSSAEGDPGNLGLALALKSLSEVTETQVDDWEEIGGLELEAFAVETWTKALLDAAFVKDTSKLKRLQDLTTDICSLNVLVLEKARDQLIEALKEWHAPTQRVVLEVFQQLGAHITLPVEPLLAALANHDPGIRQAAVKVLVVLGEQAPIEPLLMALSDIDRNVRKAASEALPSVLKWAPIEPLLTALRTCKPWELDVVVNALYVWGKERERSVELLLPALHDEHKNVLIAVAMVLGRLGERAAVGPLLEALNASEMQGSMSIEGSLRITLRLLVKQGVMEPPLAALDNSNSQVRIVALQTLGSLGERAPVERLIAALQDEEQNVRAAAMQVLRDSASFSKTGYMRSSGANIPLRRMPVDSLIMNLTYEDGQVRTGVVEVLGALGERTPIEPLVTALKDEDINVRRAIVKALTTLGKAIPVEAVVTALSDADFKIRQDMLQQMEEIEVFPPLEILAALLRDENSFVRSTAVNILAKMGKHVLMDALLASLKDDRAAVRINTIQMMQKTEDHIFLKPLFATLKDSDPQVRAEALGPLAPIKPVLAVLFDSSEYVRAKAAQLLEILGEQVPVDALIAVLKNKNADEDIRTKAVQVLGTFGERAPIEPLLNALEDSHANLRRAVIQALGKLGARVPVEPLLAALHDDEWSVCAAAAKSLVQLGERFIELLLDSLHDDNQKIRVAVAIALGEKAPLDPLLMALDMEDDDIIEAALQVLGTLEERIPIEPLLNALRKAPSYGRLRNTFVQTLGKLGEHAVEPLLAALQRQENDHVRVAIQQAIGILSEYVPAEALLAMLDDRSREVHDEVQKVLVQKLVHLGKNAPMDLLLASFHRKEAEVRAAAILTLGEKGEDAPVDLLAASLTENEWLVRAAAAQALAKLEERAPIEPLVNALYDVNLIVVSRAIEALQKQKKRAVEPLIVPLKSSDTQIRLKILRVLPWLSEWIPLEIFIDLLHDKDKEVRASAAVALGMIGKREAVEPLTIIFNDEDEIGEVRYAALQGLALLNEQEAVDRFLNLLDNKDEELHIVFKVLMAALTKLKDEPTTRIKLVAALVGILASGDLRRGSIQILGQLGELAPVEPLMFALRDKDAYICILAAEALEKLGERTPVEPLLAALGDSRQDVRSVVIKLLKQTHPDAISTVEPEATAVLLEHKPSQILGSLIMGAFNSFVTDNIEYPTPNLFEQFEKCLSWPYWEVRMRAVQALGQLRRNIPDDIIRRLYELRFDPETIAVREAANEALAEILSLETGIEDD